MDDERAIKQILKEAHTWSKLDHPNVLSVLGITTKFDSTVSIVTLWMEGGNASAYVQKQKNDPRPLIKDVALGLRYLHSHPEGPIIHADLKGVGLVHKLVDLCNICETGKCVGRLRWSGCPYRLWTFHPSQFLIQHTYDVCMWRITTMDGPGGG